MRIIAGTKKGQKLKVPVGKNIRPTLDRVKEALFSSLGEKILKAVVLDLFAGSGALSLEAVSRGAENCVLVDSSGESIGIIRQNIYATGFEKKVEVFNMDAFTALRLFKKRDYSFDVIFLDPPYKSQLLKGVIDVIFKAKILNKKGVIVVEHPKKVRDFPTGNFAVVSTKNYGDSTITWLKEEI